MKICNLFFLVLLLLSFYSRGQEIGSSEQARGNLEAKNVTVDYSTGIFHYHVPLFTLGTGSVQVPVSLDYTARGVKREDNPGLVGYNWTLNAGGIITRTVRGGMADEIPGTGYLNIGKINIIPLPEDKEAVANRKRDGENDIFTAVFNGRTVHFIICRDSSEHIYAEPLERTSVKIEPKVEQRTDIVAWTVTDEHGNRYIYRIREYASDIYYEEGVSYAKARTERFATAWYLSRVEPYNGTPIDYIYKESDSGVGLWETGGYTYTSQYRYGRPMLEHPFDFRPYRDEFETNISEAVRCLENYTLGEQLNNMLYEYIGHGEWVLNPFYSEKQKEINNNFRVLGQMSDFRNVFQSSSKLFRELKSLAAHYSKLEDQNARLAGDCFNNAANLVLKSLQAQKEVLVTNVESGSRYSVRVPLLDSIVCGSRAVRFVYETYPFYHLREVVYGCPAGPVISKVKIAGGDNPSAFVFADSSGVETERISFAYHSYEFATGARGYDLWGYTRKRDYGDSDFEDRVDAEHIKSGSLRSIVFPDGGKVELDYEPNRTADRIWGGIRLNRLVSVAGPGSASDTICYRYPLGGESVYREAFNKEIIHYEGVPALADTVIHSRMKFRGPDCREMGNNGLFYPYVQEIRPSAGMRAYWFALDSEMQPFCSNTLNGLPLAYADYNMAGGMVRLVKNRYYSNVPSAHFPTFISAGEDRLPACQVQPQVKVYEYYLDEQAILAHYKREPPLCVQDDGREICVVNPMDLYRNNILPRQQAAIPFNPMYQLLYGELNLLSCREEYRFENPSAGEASYDDILKGGPEELYRRVEYFYDDLPLLYEPVRTETTDSRGVRMAEIVRRVGGRLSYPDSVLSQMKASHCLSAVVKKEYYQDNLLQEQLVTEYESYTTGEGSPAVPARTYSYRPSSEQGVSPRSETQLFDFGRDKYVEETETEYIPAACKVFPVEESDRTSRRARCFRTVDGRVSLEALQVGKEEVLAFDLKDQYDYFVFSTGTLEGHYRTLDGLCMLRDFLEESVRREPSLSVYLERSHFRLVQSFLDGIAGTGPGNSDALGQLADSLLASGGEALSLFMNDVRNSFIYMYSGIERGVFTNAVSSLNRVVQGRLLVEDDFRQAVHFYRHLSPDIRDGMYRITHFPVSGHLKAYLLIGKDCASFHYRVDTPEGFRLEEVSVPVNRPSGPPFTEDYWRLYVVDLDLSGNGGQASLSIERSMLAPDLAYVAIVPAETEFQAMCYNPDGSVHAVFDQSGDLRVNEYDKAGRLIGVRDGDGFRLNRYGYHRAGMPAEQPGMNFSNEYSYRMERIYREGRRTESGASICNVTYFDGFGRKWQEIGIQGGGDCRSDLVQVYAYGPGGRTERTYLPYAEPSGGGGAVSSPYASSHWSEYGSADSPYAFGVHTYESSPLGRELQQTGPGYAWHAGDKGIKTEYGFNAAGRVRLYRTDASGNLLNGGYYKPGMLDRVRVTDEDGRVAEVYSDRDGREVLSVSLSASDTLETYRVYDDYGRLSWVLPPEASARLGAGTAAEILEQYAFRYVYDLLDRLVEKRLPGSAPVYILYDAKDRPVLSQDGEQRKTDRWSYTLYDDKNRGVEIGEVALPGVSLVGLRQEAGNTVHYVPSGELRALQCFEYDGYTDSSHVFVSVPGYASGYYGHVGGKRTGLRKRSLSDDRWYRETYYYDEHGRELQRIYDNALGGVSRVDRSYDFTGNVVKERESHGMADGRMDVLESSYSYDIRGRQTESLVSLNGGKPVVIRNGYDEVGRETARLYGDYPVSRTYNIRSWQTLSVSRDFHESLSYESGAGGLPGRYNGSISGVEWRNGNSTALLYLPEYDGFDRLTGVEEYRQTASGWEKNPDGYEERGIVYDRNGNIRSLQRTAGGKVVDDLEYTYTGNQLTGLSERERTETAGDVYAPGAAENGMYEYDLNGNLKKDSRRGLEYGYNSLNLLSEVRRDGQPAAKYDWLADGTKLGVKDVGGANGFVYAGSLTYRRSADGLKLETAHFGDGVIRVNENGTQEVDYFLTDHLGSVRVIVDAAGAVKERNDYYPFGARHVRSDYALSTNRWKYNGKELQTTGDLGFLDYGVRMYDLGVGRWFGMDPLAEEYTALSGYVFSGNNPLILVDENGGFFTHYVDKDYNVLFQTDDGSDDVVMVPDAYVGDFRKYSDFSSGLDYIFNSLGWNRYWKEQFGLAERQFSERELMLLDGFNTGWSRNNAAEYLLKPTAGNLISMSFSEALSQWTNPELVVGNLSVGAIGWSNVLSIRNSLPKPFTKSNLKLGQVMHKKYKIDLHDKINYIKEYRLPSGRRIDFLDIPNATIYELKPNNPRAIKMGIKQLERYKKELDALKMFGIDDWKIKLDVY